MILPAFTITSIFDGAGGRFVHEHPADVLLPPDGAPVPVPMSAWFRALAQIRREHVAARTPYTLTQTIASIGSKEEPPA